MRNLVLSSLLLVPSLAPTTSAQQVSQPGLPAAIAGLRRITTPEEDLLVDTVSLSSVESGLEFFDDVWPLADESSSYAVSQLDTAAVSPFGRAENHMLHDALALPPETPVLTLPGVGPVSARYHGLQLNSSGLDQGYVEVYSEPNGDVAGTWAVSLADTLVDSSFQVIVDPPRFLTGRMLTLNSRFHLQLSGAPSGALQDGALLRKEIGNSYLQAVFSAAQGGWHITGRMENGRRPARGISEFRAGQDLGIMTTAVQIVGVGEVLNALEQTDFAVGVVGNDGVGPQAMLMQISSLNAGSAGLFAR